MDSTLFEEWVRELDVKFLKEKRKVVLIIDNCPAHPAIGNLTNVKLIFLPPNTTSVSQPMDQGVIRCLKAHYRRRLVRRMLQCLDKGKDLPKISILQALQILVASWNDVTEATIVNYFKKAKISEQTQTDALEDSDDPFTALEEELSELRKADPMLIPVEITAAELVGTDSDLITTEAPTTDKEITGSVNLEEDGINDEDNDNDGGEEICDDPVVKPTVYEVSSALEALKNACLFSIKWHEMQRFWQQFESLYSHSLATSRKQTDITSFFQEK